MNSIRSLCRKFTKRFKPRQKENSEASANVSTTSTSPSAQVTVPRTQSQDSDVPRYNDNTASQSQPQVQITSSQSRPKEQEPIVSVNSAKATVSVPSHSQPANLDIPSISSDCHILQVQNLQQLSFSNFSIPEVSSRNQCLSPSSITQVPAPFPFSTYDSLLHNIHTESLSDSSNPQIQNLQNDLLLYLDQIESYLDYFLLRLPYDPQSLPNANLTYLKSFPSMVEVYNRNNYSNDALTGLQTVDFLQQNLNQVCICPFVSASTRQQSIVINKNCNALETKLQDSREMLTTLRTLTEMQDFVIQCLTLSGKTVDNFIHDTTDNQNSLSSLDSTSNLSLIAQCPILLNELDCIAVRTLNVAPSILDWLAIIKKSLSKSLLGLIDQSQSQKRESLSYGIENLKESQQDMQRKLLAEKLEAERAQKLSEKTTCGICEMEDQAELRMAACSHIYCTKCWLNWLARNQSCPMCRRPLHPLQLQELLRREEKSTYKDRVDISRLAI